jgi:hypothetical protein
MLKNKNGDDWYGYNNVYVIYSETVASKEKGSDKKFKATKVYLPVKFTKIVKAVDGTISYERDSYGSIEGETKLEYSWWSKVKGYTNGKDMYEDLISPNKADYDYEISTALQSFGN